MKKLSTAFAWVAWLTLGVSLICGIVFALKSESGGLLLFVYWAVGGAVSCMFAMSQYFLLKVAARANDKMDADECAKIKQQKSQGAQSRKVVANTAIVKPIEHDGYILCPICGCKQTSDMFCLECGVEFARAK